MNFSDIGKTFGVFLNDMDKIIYDDNWILRAKVFGGLGLCDNAAGLKIMTDVLDRINAQIGPLKTENDAWLLTKFDFSTQVGNMIVDLEFRGFENKSARARVYIKKNSFNATATVYHSNVGSYTINSNNINLGDLWSSRIASSAICSDNYTTTNVYEDDKTSDDDDNLVGNVIINGNDSAKSNVIINGIDSAKSYANDLTYNINTSYSNATLYKNDYEDRINTLENTIYKLTNNNKFSV